jgi:uncharacterized membrane protein
MPRLLRPALIGVATGARSFTGLAACARTAAGPGRVDRLLHHSRIRRALTSGAAVELLGDKLPVTPPRTQPPSLAARVLLGAVSGAIVSGRAGGARATGALAGAGSAAGWTLLGPRLRAAAAARLDGDLRGALAEDVLAIALAVGAARR